MSLARAVYSGGTGIVSSPSTGISVTTARTPTQCAAVVGVSTVASSPGTTGPAATGSAAAAAGPPSASALASKTGITKFLSCGYLLIYPLNGSALFFIICWVFPIEGYNK